MRIAVIGANGQLGHDLLKVIPKEECIPLTRADVDVTDFAHVQENLAKHQPDVVINTSAYHRVDDCEKDATEAFRLNAVAVHNLAVACKNLNATLVHFSTDYVFGGDSKRTTPLTETDQPAPVNAYGVSKVAGEMLVQEVLEKYFLIRVCGLFGFVGSAGKGGNFVETMIRIGKEKGAVRVVDDQILVPTYTLDIAKNVYALIKTGKYGLYHMVNHGQTSWYNFAKTIFELCDLPVQCTPITSAEYPTPAKRPGFSVMRNARLEAIGVDQMRPWGEGLKDYLVEKGHRK